MGLTQSQALARYIVGLSYPMIPQKMIADMKALILDFLGVTLYGSKMSAARIAVDFFRSLGEKGESTVIGYGYKVSAISAALCNAVSTDCLEFCDVDPEGWFHLSPAVVAPAISVAELEGANGKTFLTALVAGSDIMARLAAVMNPSLRNRGFHPTTACGVFTAAAAAGKLLGLNEEQLTNALGLAGAQACGSYQIYEGSMQKRLNGGVAARNGVTAALLAQRGFTGETTFLEGDKGFGRAYAGITDWTKLTDKLGEESPLVIEFKPYPCVRPVHNGIDCALEIRGKHGIDPDDIDEIVVNRHPAWAEWQLIYEPRTFDHATFSFPFGVALSLVKGKAGIEEYLDTANYTDALIVKVAKKIRVIKDSSLPRPISCAMVVHMKNGATYRAQVDYAKGHPRNPMTRDELTNKFRALASAVIPEKQMSRVIEMVDGLEEVKNISQLYALLRPK